jgi:Fe-S-cluster containining protein
MTIYIRRGDCNRCGDCCKPRFLIHEDAREFYRENGLPENGQCQFLALVDDLRTCTMYANRASFCQAFPWHPDQIKGLDRCSYTFVSAEDD